LQKGVKTKSVHLVMPVYNEYAASCWRGRGLRFWIGRFMSADNVEEKVLEIHRELEAVGILKV
jgi:hypothetical protein